MENKEEIKNNFLAKAKTFYYGCDSGSLKIMLGSNIIKLLNCTGDGEGIVYIVRESHFILPSPFDDDLILTTQDKRHSIHLGLYEYDLSLEDDMPALHETGNRIEISRIKDTKNFIIRIS